MKLSTIFVLAYFIPLVFSLSTAALSLFSRRVSTSMRIYTYLDVLIVTLVAIVPVFNIALLCGLVGRCFKISEFFHGNIHE